VKQVPGGVGRNIAEAVASLSEAGLQPAIISAVADDPAGCTLLAACRQQGIDTSGITVVRGKATPTVSIIFDRSGEVAACVADVELLELEVTSSALQRHAGLIQSAGMLVIDGNMAAEAVQAACRIARAAGVPVLFEPVSAPKAARCARRSGPTAARLQWRAALPFHCSCWRKRTHCPDCCCCCAGACPVPGGCRPGPSSSAP
jgi:pseudouridine kinase